MCLLVSGSFSTTFSFCFATFSLAQIGHLRNKSTISQRKALDHQRTVTLHYKQSAQSHECVTKQEKPQNFGSSHNNKSTSLTSFIQPKKKFHLISFQVAFFWDKLPMSVNHPYSDFHWKSAKLHFRFHGRFHLGAGRFEGMRGDGARSEGKGVKFVVTSYFLGLPPAQ